MPDFSPERFAKLVQQFCQWAESDPDPGRDVVEVHLMFSDIYAMALRLPEPEEAEYLSNSTQCDWKSLHRRFGSLPFQYYSEFYDPFEQEEPVVGDICDDLADIYQDLAVGLQAWKEGQKKRALAHWQLSFTIHWSEHASGALRALDRYRHDREEV